MYDVAALVERGLEPLDADQLVALHEGLDEPVTYHLLRPVESTTAMLASSLSVLGGTEVVTVSPPSTVVEVQEQLRAEAVRELERSIDLLVERGQRATATTTEEDPVEALVELVRTVDAAEAIVLTEPHVVREFLHVDWTSRAKRHLDVPTLHLLEHVSFSGQVR